MSAQQAMPQSQTAAPAKPIRRKAAGRDLLVQITIPLVAMSLTLALHMHAGLSIALAMLMSLLACGSLALAHIVHQRGLVIRALRAELARLQRAAQPASAPPAASGDEAGERRPISVIAPPPTMPERRDATLGGGGAPPATGAASAQACEAALDSLRRLDPPAAPQAAPASDSDITVPVLASSPKPNARLDAPPPLPAVTGSPLTPAAPDGGAHGAAARPDSLPFQLPGVPLEGPAAAKPAAPQSQPQMTAREGGGPVAPKDDRAEAALLVDPAARIHVDSSDRVMATYWAVRPGLAPEADLPAGRDAAPADASPRITGTDVAAAPAPAVRAPAAPAIDSVDAAELAAMQSFIKQLSAQLNPPKEPAGGAGRAEAATREDIGAASDPLQTSVDALRATADTLRAARQQPPREPHRRAQAGAPADASPVTSSATETPSRNEAVGPAAQSPPSRSRIADIREAIAADRLDLLLDPILGLGDRKARHFEVSVRVRTGDGQALDAEAVASMAPGAGLVPQLDAAKLSRSVRVAGRLQARGNNASLFSTLALESLSEGSFLDSFDTVLTGQRPLLRRLVLSFAQSDVRRFGERHWDAVARLAESGLRLSLEHVTDLDMDFESLHEHGFDFVKLDADVFLKGLPMADGVVPASDICRHFSDHGLAVIVGHIEDEEKLARILGFGVLFGQGTLFGGPRAVAVDASDPPRTAAA